MSLGFTDNLTVETGFAIERSTDGVTFTQLATAPARAGTGAVTFVDTTVTYGTTYTYRVADITPFGNSATRTPPGDRPGAASRTIRPDGGQWREPGQPASGRPQLGRQRHNETGFTVQRATDAGFTTGVVNTTNAARNATTVTITGLSRNTDYYFRIRANNGTVVSSGWLTRDAGPIHHHPVTAATLGRRFRRRPSFPKPARAVLSLKRTRSCSRRECPDGRS